MQHPLTLGAFPIAFMLAPPCKRLDAGQIIRTEEAVRRVVLYTLRLSRDDWCRNLDFVEIYE